MWSCLWKLELGFWTYGLISRLGPNCSKLVFRPHTPNLPASGSKNFFMSSSIRFYMKQALIFKFWVIYDCLFPENYKNPSKIFSLVTFQLNPFFVFWSTKIQIPLQPLGQMILKISPFWNSFINGFKMM